MAILNRIHSLAAYTPDSCFSSDLPRHLGAASPKKRRRCISGFSLSIITRIYAPLAKLTLAFFLFFPSLGFQPMGHAGLSFRGYLLVMRFSRAGFEKFFTSCPWPPVFPRTTSVEQDMQQDS